MKYLATFATFFSMASASGWTLYCGDSCSNGTAIISGGEFDAQSCTNFDTTYDYCYFESDYSWNKAVVLEGEDCVVSSTDVETVIWDGECTDAGSWSSYIIVLNL